MNKVDYIIGKVVEDIGRLKTAINNTLHTAYGIPMYVKLSASIGRIH